MLHNSDLTYINANGKQVHGTAAFLHRVFGGQSKLQEENERKAGLEACKRLIRELGYANPPD